MEELVTRVASLFVNVRHDEADEVLTTALSDIGRTASVDRCYLFLIAPDGTTMDNTHEWCARGITPQKENLQAVPLTAFPWWMAQLRANAVIDIRDVNSLPDEAGAEREILQAQSIISVLMVAVFCGERLEGFLGFDWVGSPSNASAEDIRLLRLAAQIIGDALEHQADERHLRRLNRALKVSTACSETVIRADDESTLLGNVCRQIVEDGGYAMAWVGYAEPGGTVRAMARAGSGTEYVDKISVTWDDRPTSNGPGGRAIKTGEVQVTDSFARDPRFAPWWKAAKAFGFSSGITLPLLHDGRPFGFLAIYASEAVAFDEGEIQLLLGLAENLAFGIYSLRNRLARLAAESTLQLSNRAIEAARNGVVIAAASENGLAISYVNPAFETTTGYKAEEVIGRAPTFLYGNETDQPAVAALHAALARQRAASVLLRNYRKDGSLFWNELFISPVRDENGRLTHYVGIINDVTERQQYQTQLEYKAQYDELTGLPNRTLMHDRLERALIHAKRHGTVAAVLFLDLDRFKLINDSLGHPAGDEVLRQTADRLLQCGRQEDTVARYGGDEFVIVLTDFADEQAVSRIARRIQESIGCPLEVGGHDLHLTASVGISLFPRDGDRADMLLQNADTAMYQAKNNGRSSLQYYREELNARMLERLTLESRLQKAIDNGELRLHYQPLTRVSDGQPAGLEALVRWQHPELGLVPPTRFIPLAEESGLVVPLGEWVIRTVCAKLAEWQQSELAGLPVAVNLSVKQLDQEDFVDRMKTILDETGVSPSLLEMEVTESALMNDLVAMVGQLERLKALGCKLSLDDFGTGYSNLSYLKRFPFDRLKIDQSFVSDITTDPQDAAIAKTIIAMARTLNLQVLAEGVETEAQFHYLRRNGCELVQGFLFSRPESAEDLPGRLAAMRSAPLIYEVPSDERPALLIVDDEPNITHALQRLLHREDYSVLTTNDPLQALEMLALNNVRVILADQRMPQMTGTELLSRVKDLYPDVVRITLSGYTELSTVTEAVNKGWIYKFITKPWEDGDLRDQLREAFQCYERNRAKQG